MKLGRLAVLLLSLAIGACNVVTLPEPLGERPAHLEPGEWDGHWLLTPELVVHVAVTDPQAGAFELSWITKSKGPGRPRTELAGGEAVMRQVGDVLVASLRLRGHERYLFAALARDGERATLWFPDAECVRSQMDAGALRGSTVKHYEDVELALLGLDSARAVSREGPGCPVIAWNKPAHARRITSLEN